MRGAATGAGSSPLGTRGRARLSPPSRCRRRPLLLSRAPRPLLSVGSLVSPPQPPQLPAVVFELASRGQESSARRGRTRSRRLRWARGFPPGAAVPRARPPGTLPAARQPPPRRGRAPPAALGRQHQDPGPWPWPQAGDPGPASRSDGPARAVPGSAPRGLPRPFPRPARPAGAQAARQLSVPVASSPRAAPGRAGALSWAPRAAGQPAPVKRAWLLELKWERNSLQLHFGFYVKHETWITVLYCVKSSYVLGIFFFNAVCFEIL